MKRYVLVAAWLALVGCPAVLTPAPLDSPSRNSPTIGPTPSTSSSATPPLSGHAADSFSIEPRTVCLGGSVTVEASGLKANRVTCWLIAQRPPLPGTTETEEPYAVKLGEQIGGATSATFKFTATETLGPTTITGGNLVLEPGRSYTIKVTTNGTPASIESGFMVAGPGLPSWAPQAACAATTSPAPTPTFEVTPQAPCIQGALRLRGRGFVGKQAVIVLEGKNTSQRFFGFYPFIQAATVALPPDGVLDYSWQVPASPPAHIPTFLEAKPIDPSGIFRMAVYDQDGTRYVPQAGEFKFDACVGQ